MYIRIFLSRIFSRLSSGMTGALSLPFTIAAAWVPGLPQRLALATMAIIAFLYASYDVWANEYLRAKASEDRLTRRRPRVVPEIIRRDTMPGGESLVLSNVGETSAHGVTLESAGESRFGITFDTVQLIRPGESRINVTARSDGASNLREAVTFRHIAAVSSGEYQQGSFEVPIRLTYQDPDGEPHTDEAFAFTFNYGPSGAPIDTQLIVRHRQRSSQS